MEEPCYPYQLHRDLVYLHPTQCLWERGLSESPEMSVLPYTLEETPSQAESLASFCSQSRSSQS